MGLPLVLSPLPRSYRSIPVRAAPIHVITAAISQNFSPLPRFPADYRGNVPAADVSDDSVKARTRADTDGPSRELSGRGATRWIDSRETRVRILDETKIVLKS